MHASRFVLLAASMGSLLAAPAAAAIIFDADFEAPTYALGSVHGQEGWSAGIGSPHDVSNAQAHGGTQSLNGVRDQKDFDAPFTGLAPSWFVEAWCYTPPMPGSYSSRFSIGNVLNDHFWIELRGDGQLTFYSFSTLSVRSLGPVALNKWLRFRAELISFPSTVRYSVTGDGVNETWEYDMIAAGAPSFLGVAVNPPANVSDLPNGAPYWDDILVSDERPTSASSNSWGRLKALYR